MEKNKITITTIPVTIKVVEVGGKKLTLSVFRQIPRSPFFHYKTEDERRNSFLGWVKHEGYKYVVFHRDGILLRDSTFDSTGREMEVFKPYLKNENQIYIYRFNKNQ